MLHNGFLDQDAFTDKHHVEGACKVFETEGSTKLGFFLRAQLASKDNDSDDISDITLSTIVQASPNDERIMTAGQLGRFYLLISRTDGKCAYETF